MIDSQRRLKNSLAKQAILFIESGRLKLRDGDTCKVCGAQDSHFQEKGVDVRMAIDLVLDSQKSDVKSIILLSSDTDLLPAVDIVRESEKKLIYVGFSDRLTNALVSGANETQIIRDSEVIAAFEDANLSLPIKE
jgi:uncharacterized LabA/DUF88 family protein